MRLGSIVAALGAGVVQLAAGATFEPLLPPSYPLAVRNPYLSAWLPGMNTSAFASTTPQFWTGSPLNLGVMAQANGHTYSLFSIASAPNGTTAASLTNATYTSTHTIFTLAADSLTFTLDFFSPVSPKNYLRQTLPFSYLTVSVEGAQGSTYIYADFDDSWTGQNASTVATFNATKNLAAYQLTAQGPALYEEAADMALWGTAVFAADTTSANVSTQIGAIQQTRGAFAASGKLSNENGNYVHGDVVAISQAVQGSGAATFAVGYVRGEKTINYFGTDRAGYYMTQYPQTLDALAYFFSDYSAADSESKSLDSTISSTANAAAGSNYSDILALTLRQTYGALDLTLPAQNLSNTDDLMLFVKEISSDGNVNTIDVIEPTSAVWYSMSPDYIRLALEPVMQYLETGGWTQPFMIHDIGRSYPNATGYTSNNTAAEAQPVEESGNLAILTYAYQMATGDKTFAQRYRNYMQKYAEFLVTGGLNITAQLSTDDSAGVVANQTNLAIKAAIGLNAFGHIYDLQNYTNIARNFSYQLYNEGLGTDPNKTHFTLQYGNYSTWVKAYNLYADKLLNLTTFDEQAFVMESNYLPTQRAQFGIPLDTLVDFSNTPWSMYVAAFATTAELREASLNDVHALISENKPYNQIPFADIWYSSDRLGHTPGEAFGYRARPVVGAHFSILALKGANTINLS